MTPAEASTSGQEAHRESGRRASAAPPPSKSQTLTNRLKRGQAPDEATAELVVAGLGANAVTAVKFSAMTYGEVDLTSCLNALVDSAERVNRGDLGKAEALLTAQAVTLNAMFTNLVSRAPDSLYVESFNSYMRFGLKAQAQCRATLETLAAIKNPPTIFARQANIANGPQLVTTRRSYRGLARACEVGTRADRTFRGLCRTGGRRSGGSGSRRRSGAGNRGSRQPAQEARPASDVAR